MGVKRSRFSQRLLQMESATMEVDRDLEPFPTPKAATGVLDRVDLGVGLGRKATQ